MKVLLYNYVATNRHALLAGLIQTPWEIDDLPDITDRELAKKKVAQADAMIGISFEADLTAVANKLKLIHVPGAGYDAYKLDLLPKGVRMCNCFEHEVPIAEYVMLNVLLQVTEQNRYSATMRRGRWDGSGRHDGAFHDEALGKTIGLIGFGHIGQEVARRAKAFGMRVLAIRQKPAAHPHLDWCGGMSDLPQLLRESDFVVIACPLTPTSKGMLGETQLKMMKPTAYLINPSRGPIIDEAALYDALKNKRIAGAALDAWWQYPPDIHPTMHGATQPFHELENVTLTPHFSAWTEQMITRRYRRIAENLDRLHHGQPLERVVFEAK